MVDKVARSRVVAVILAAVSTANAQRAWADENGDTPATRVRRNLLAAQVLLKAGNPDQARAQLGAASKTIRLVPEDASTGPLRCELFGFERDLFVDLPEADRQYLAACPARVVDGDLYRLAFPPQAQSLVKKGRFADALASLGSDSAPMPVRSFLTGIVRSSEECTFDPFSATATLSKALADIEPAAGRVYERATSELIDGSDITLASRDLIRLEAHFDPQIGNVIDRVSRCAQAVGLEARAYRYVRLRMFDLAFSEALLAKHVSSEVVDRSGLFLTIGRARVRQLLARGASLQAAGDSELAYAYRLAAAAIQGFPHSSVTLLAANEALVRKRLRRTVAVRTVGAVSPAFASRFEREVSERLPSYLELNANGGAGREADAELTYSIVGPRRQFKGHVEVQHKQVVAYEAMVPNPAYEEAETAYNDAVDNLNSAREQYEILHQGANTLANQANAGSGISATVSAIAALGSGAEEITGATMLHSAQDKLSEARRRLQSTRRKVREKQMVDSSYPSIVLTETATSYFTYRLALPGVPPTERTVPFSATATSSYIPPAARIGVVGSSDSIDLAQLRPDLTASVADLGGKVAALLRALEENRIWRAASDAARAGDVDGAAIQYVAYLHANSVDVNRNKEALQYLVRNLR